MRVVRGMVLVAAVVLAACSGEGNGSTGPGTGHPAFTADVTGDVQTSVKGDAKFGNVVDGETGQEAFAVEMAEDDPTGGALIQIVRIGNWSPAPGSYPLTDAVHGNPGDGDWVATAYDTDNGQVTAIFAATGGTVKITGVRNGRLQGSFAFDAVGGQLADPNTSMAITVSGQFTANQSVGQCTALHLKRRQRAH